jgi:hypothetical protein
MPTRTDENVKALLLDLKNFRTVAQPDEQHAINALIGIEPEWFWALMESLLDDGYSPTENIIVLKTNGQLIVKEGNRRIAAMKLILGIHKSVEVPDNIQQRIAGLSTGWKSQNAKVPCAVYEAGEAAHVDKLVSRTHAKGEKAGRADWTAAARARYGRDQNKQAEPGLDLLEKYLISGKNLSAAQAERWAGDFPVTVLDEAVQKLAPYFGLKTAAEVVSAYPSRHKKALDSILYDIGIAHLGFKELRDTTVFWGVEYGIGIGSSTPGGAASSGAGTGKKKKGTAAYASNDPKSVRKLLRNFEITGSGRDKVVTLVNEMKGLRHEHHPHAFCFLLRSTFELSAKAYCNDHKKSGGPDPRKPDGSDKALSALLREITGHLTNHGKDKARVKALHGSMAELGKPNGILSVTSLNQLVHNPSFSIAPSDISLLFCNVFPLLQEMNG